MKEAIRWVEDYEEIDPDYLIIRCKDCAFWAFLMQEAGMKFGMCNKHDIGTIPQDYCSKGKRRP